MFLTCRGRGDLLYSRIIPVPARLAGQQGHPALHKQPDEFPITTQFKTGQCTGIRQARSSRDATDPSTAKCFETTGSSKPRDSRPRVDAPKIADEELDRAVKSFPGASNYWCPPTSATASACWATRINEPHLGESVREPSWSTSAAVNAESRPLAKRCLGVSSDCQIQPLTGAVTWTVPRSIELAAARYA